MKTAIVTGASSGIGKETARLLDQKGYTVYNFSRSGENDGQIHHISVDVVDEASLQRALLQVIEETGRLDLLVCNAGFGISGPVEFTELTEAKEQFDVNFFGAFRCVKASLVYLRETKGRVVFVSSVAAVFSIPFQSFYSASKAAVNSLASSLANELQPMGVRVSCVMPGDVRTGFTNSRRKGTNGADVYETMHRAVEKMEEDEQKGLSPTTVACVILKAVSAKRPTLFYVVGVKYRLFVFLGRILPFSLQNRLVGKLYR